jgi:hypothetical protein
MVIFDSLEAEAKQELIRLYEDFIKNSADPSLEKRALACDQKYGAVPILSKQVASAGSEAASMAIGEMTVEEAKEILADLK